jgi:hypothetical protein
VITYRWGQGLVSRGAAPLWAPWLRSLCTVADETLRLYVCHSLVASECASPLSSSLSWEDVARPAYRTYHRRVRQEWRNNRFRKTKSNWEADSLSSREVHSSTLGGSTVYGKDVEQYCIYRINGFSDFVHRPDSKELEDKKTMFWKLGLFPV